jgi:tetratricopeptide (TPR) repeat protein
MPATKNQCDDARLRMRDGIFPRGAGRHVFSSILQLRFLLFLVVAFLVAGCSPSGPRALLNGQKLLERGDYAGAVARLKTATTLMATNAQAWNYYGVACQHTGQFADAAAAYQNALKLDRDLTEAHYNLGCLWLEQDKPDAARTEFTAYTLRRPNALDGWLKLGTAQLRAGDYLAAERSFGTAYVINTNNAEALNGIGLARVQRGRAREAAQYFAAAIWYHPDYAPALLNLATVEHEYLHDDTAAMDHYRKYLALTPRPADWGAVNALVQTLARPATVASANPPPTNQTPTTTPETASARGTKPEAIAPSRPVQPARTPPVARENRPPKRETPSPPPEVVRIAEPEPVIATAPATSAPPATTVVHRANPLLSPRASGNYAVTGVTPLPEYAPTPDTTPKPARVVPPARPVFPRYAFLSPRKPAAGDRQAAAVAFSAAQQAERQQNLAQAEDGYGKAAQLDPSWFEAQYNYGVLAGRQRDFSHSLAAYEMALAIRPDSADTRFNFALELKAAGCATDAENELNKIIAANPNDARAHLALANLYAQQMRDPARAREQYLKVLELDPRGAEAADIRFWLSANPP